MNKGDKCWFWSAVAERNVGKICEGVIADWPDNGPFASVQTTMRERPYTIFKDELFPTREALCDHYRKVFER